MSESTKPLPKPVFVQQMRPIQKNIPQTKGEREHVWRVVKDYVANNKVVFPLSFDDLKEYADDLLSHCNINPIYRDYIAVLINNAACRDLLASIPFERRLLLLPKCLRKEDTCKAPFDEFGLLCKHCGMCSIQDFQLEAERLGYAVLVAEGSPIVVSIIQTGKIEAIVGVSCLAVLERMFPYMEGSAIPGLAIPLLQDDCANTNVDLDWLWDVIHLTSEDKTYRMDLDGLREEINTWFDKEPLSKIMGEAKNKTQEIAHEWLGKSGKRWRPFLTVCSAQAIKGVDDVSSNLKKLAVAVECFHKASLIHDDIEDNDALRYGEKTLHEDYGVPVALNVGDFLIAEGYRLIAECDIDAECKNEILQLAIAGHRELCIGQGAELCWMREPKPLKAVDVVDVFRKKTAPAFETALRIGATYAGAEEEIHDVLEEYSESLGIAYQIRDDLNDIEGEADDIHSMRLSLILAIAHEKAVKDDKKLLADLWTKKIPVAENWDNIQKIIEKNKAVKRATQLLESYKEQATRSIRYIENHTLKGLLRRVISKIFNDLEIKGWCSEFEARNVASRETGTETVAGSKEPNTSFSV
ncbi:polyprenyl synthetase family protein [Candidatus Uabimicrobium amorphum]|uniref:Polyprenyl synthetase n=1 Tax=Uabimicrobium amorphum TaxID=2596890 RepID=A0A5S9IQ97_UABAM|nr:polyprenyl synthetase family protein [Candidatus Uabimicrobium amorphum]BBM86089.1 polyprenyl synthetase [Candidatus Uabimicrobium amorphum]